MFSYPELAHEAAERGAIQGIECGRIACVAAHGIGAVTVDDDRQTLGDFIQGLIPADRLELAGRHLLERLLQPVRITVDVQAVDAFVADEAFRNRVFLVRLQRDQRFVVYGRDQTAGGLADPAEGSFFRQHLLVPPFQAACLGLWAHLRFWTICSSWSASPVCFWVATRLYEGPAGWPGLLVSLP